MIVPSHSPIGKKTRLMSGRKPGVLLEAENGSHKRQQEVGGKFGQGLGSLARPQKTILRRRFRTRSGGVLHPLRMPVCITM